MKHTFRIVWMREYADDIEACGWTEPVTPEKMIAQIKAEVDANPQYKDRLRFSQAVLMVHEHCYMLAEVDFEHPGDDREAFAAFIKEFQKTFDEYGASGQYEIVPNDDQPRLREVWRKINKPMPVPPWLE